MKQFEVGKTYSMRSICDHDCVWTYTVTGRTAQTITITDGKTEKRCKVSKKISEMNGQEIIFPFGQYSMAPRLRA